MPITQSTRKILWARSGNRCAKCRRTLIEDATELDDDAVVGEERHIFAQGTNGPRSEGTPPIDLHHHSNLILLCGSCHTIVDSQTATHTVESLRRMRDEHDAWVRTSLGGIEGPAPSSPSATSVSPEWNDGDSLPAWLTADQLFLHRLSDAFPGSRRLTVIDDAKAAVERLCVLLRRPLHQIVRSATSGETNPSHPFWWFRGSLCLHIEAFDQIGPTRCLLDYKELAVKRIASFRRSYPSMWDFVYVEASAEPPCGVYPHDDGEPMRRAAASLGGYYYSEEYALWNDRAISRADFDDGATLVNGVPSRVVNAELRERFLTPYNFIICGHRHVINEQSADLGMRTHLDGILRGTSSVEDLVKFVDKLSKPGRFYSEWD